MAYRSAEFWICGLGDTSHFGTVMQPSATIRASYSFQHDLKISEPLAARNGNEKLTNNFLARLEP